MKAFNNKNLPGFSLLEMVVAIAILAILFTFGYQVFDVAIVMVDRSRQSTLAEILTQDLIELAVSTRNEGWSSLVPGQYYLVEDPDPANGFVFIPGTQTIGEFTRSITISTVQRDAYENIVSSGGVVDENTLFLSAVTSWTNRGKYEEVRLHQYVTNWNGF